MVVYCNHMNKQAALLPVVNNIKTVNSHVQEPMILGFRLITFLFTRSLVRNQPKKCFYLFLEYYKLLKV